MFDFDVDLTPVRNAPATCTVVNWPEITEQPLNIDLMLGNFFPEIADPRGGRVVDVASSLYFNNLHVPYRGGDFQSAHFTPDGQPCGYHWMLPYADDTLTDVSTLHAIRALKDKSTGLGGQNAQRWAESLFMGVTND